MRPRLPETFTTAAKSGVRAHAQRSMSVALGLRTQRSMSVASIVSAAAAFSILGVVLGETRAAQAAPDVAATTRTAVPGWLGVALDKNTSGATGVRVTHVVRTSPADDAGLREGDLIIDLEGVVCAEPSAVTRLVSSHPPGSIVPLRIRRGGALMILSPKLQVRPAPDELLRREHQGRFAPEFTLDSPENSDAGAPVRLGNAPASLKDLRGNVVLVDFWATWCGPCRTTIPMLNAFSARYVSTGFRVLGVSTESAERIATFAAMERVTYGLFVDRAGDITRRYGVTSFPSMFLLDRRGVVRHVWVGIPESAELELRIKALLDEKVDP